MRKIYLSLALLCAGLITQAATGSAEQNALKGPAPKEEAQDIAFRNLYAKGTPYAGLSPAQEDLNKRTLEAKHFKITDTKRTALIGAGPVHYLEDGQWKTIGYNIAPNTSGVQSAYSFYNKWNSFKSLYGSSTVGNKIILANNSEIKLWQSPQIIFADQNLQPVSVIGASASSPAAWVDRLTHRDLFARNVDAQFEQRTTGNELSYIIRDNNLFNSLPAAVKYFGFSEVIDIPQGWSIRAIADPKTKNEIVAIYDQSGKIQVRYKDAVVKEAPQSTTRKPFDEKDPLSQTHINAQFSVKMISATRAEVIYYAGIDWFTFANRNFPLVFDPLVDCYPDNSSFWTGTAYRHADNCNFNFFGCFCWQYTTREDGTDNQFRIGYEDFIANCGGYDNRYYQPYAKINLSSIPNNACINSSVFSAYQNGITSGANTFCTVASKFRFGDFGGDPVTDTWSTIYGNINGLTNEYNRWDVFGTNCNCGTTACADYQENGGNSYRSFNAGAAAVSAALGTGFINYALDNCYEFNNMCDNTGDDTYYIDFDGYNGTNKPYARIDYDVPPTAPTAVTSSAGPRLCPGGSTTLTLTGGSLGTLGVWKWYAGGCGSGAAIASGVTSITVVPTVTTTYYVRAESSCGGPTACASYTVVVDTLSTAPTSVSGTTVICNGDNTTLSVVGGSLGSGAQWIWYSGSCNSTPIGTGSSITVSPVATTNYYVQASGNCNSTACAGVTVTVNIKSTDPTAVSGVSTICRGSSTYLTVQGGSLGTGAGWYWYKGSCGGAAVATGSSITVSPDSTATYYVRAEGVCDTTLCASLTITVNQQPNGGISATPARICPGGTARLTFHFTAGTPPYSITYTDGVNSTSLSTVRDGDTLQVTPTITGLYNFIQITDSLGCSRSFGFGGGASVVVAPAPAVYSLSVDQTRCFGDSSAAITIFAAGGTLPFQYSIDGGANYALNNAFTHLVPGTYNIQIRDNLGCIATATAPVTITQPAALSVTDSLYNAACAGASTAAVHIQVSGGTVPYSFVWSDGHFTQNLDAVTAGTYSVRVSDANACVTTATYTVTAPAPLVLTFDSTRDLKCYGQNVGYISAQVSGGVPNYTYLWSNSANTPIIDNLPGGNYILLVTDQNNCTISSSHTIASPSAILSSVAGNNPDCNGNASGFAVVSPAGGTPPYAYAWSTNPVQTGVMAIKLAGDAVYQVTISDVNGCTKTDSVTIIQPSKVSVAFTQTDATCFSGNDGSVIVLASGGNAPYSYYLNGVYQLNDTFTGLVAGNYVIVAEDVNKCNGAATFTITQPGAFTLDAGRDVTAFRNEPVQLRASAFSTNGIKGFDWNAEPELSCTACADPIATCDSTKSFVVKATDSAGCIQFDTVTVLIKKEFLYYIPAAFTPNGDGLNERFEFNILGAKSISIQIWNRWGEKVYDNPAQLNGIHQGGSNGWDGTFKDKLAEMDTYTYQIIVQLYGEDNTRTITGTVTPMR